MYISTIQGTGAASYVTWFVQ